MAYKVGDQLAFALEHYADIGLAVFDYGSRSNGIVSASVAGVLKPMLMRNL